jgi:hypothetical protein
LDNSPITSNSWLSFIDADGSFYFNFKLNKDGLPIDLLYYMVLTQRQEYSKDSYVGKSYLPVLQTIADCLSTKVTSIERVKASYTERAYQVKTDKKDSKGLLLQYLDKYPLFSSKNFQYKL